ncbi:DeoR/GlpR family DNA-binding transcription regulator [Paenibacillus spongiae]|uniref:DeoR/GlpR family DNA-binding transcription regulator n=1 Tax=Paenibacillus spongiae TaxID=2909671 RepID=A0ABY5S5A1_9BACL|nr:DeoR/GlpR family DNA-binding transcription regulator [Paenibacillus spongiae]UVI29087.1 DeoR/GlpR family DNA-binding transcription regulator [Paenibacillus spongiae]
MLTEERRQQILELLQRNQRIVAKDLADLFHVSVDSIRRDLTIMKEQGLLKKTYGGAIPVTQLRSLPLPESLRYGEGSPHQNAISRLAASYIGENDSVFIGGAGIHYGMLKYLSRTMPFTVITNSLKIAQTIREMDNIESYLIGGRLRSASGNLIDPLAIEQIRRFSLDLCFITGGGVSSKGISTTAPDGASFARTVNEISRRTICLAPHEKMGVDMFARTLPIHELDLVITDAGAPAAVIREIEDQGVEVVVAAAESDSSASGL